MRRTNAVYSNASWLSTLSPQLSTDSARHAFCLHAFQPRIEVVEHVASTCLKDPADKNIRHRSDMMWIFANELADAELTAVPGLGQFADPRRPASKVRHPFTKLRARRVAVLQPFDNRIPSELPAFESEPHARRIDRVDETPRIADEHPAIARRLAG